MASETMNEYLERCRKKRKSHRTINQYRSVLSRFLDVVPLEKADAEAVDSYIAGLSDGYSVNTVRLHAAVISGFLDWAVRKKLVAENPFRDGVSVPESVQTQPRVADSDKVVAVVNDESVPVEARIAIGLGYYCGLRREEIAKVEIANIDTEARTITVVGKRKKVRTVVIPENGFSTLLQNYVAPRVGKYLFGGPEKSGVDATTIWRWIKRYAGTNPHSLRHALGVEAARKGVHPAVIARCLGHSDMRTTFIYTQMAGTDLVAMADAVK